MNCNQYYYLKGVASGKLMSYTLSVVRRL